VLEEFLGRPKTAPIYQQGWVDLMIDVDRDTNGKAINQRLMNDRKGGLPWIVVLDAEGKEIVSSNAEPSGGNIGAPVQPDECAWFAVMMERSRGDKVGKEQLAAMLADLEEFAKPKRR
jgi:hypothetical protein